MRVYGAERVPRAGAAVIASNHIAGIDPSCSAWPAPRVAPLHGEGRAVARTTVLRRVMPHTRRVPRATAATPTARRCSQARAVLRSGNLLGIFVEGTRQTSDEIGAARTGVAMCAVLENARSSPPASSGTDRHGRNPFAPRGGHVRARRSTCLASEGARRRTVR